MFDILTLNKIAKCGLDKFDENYHISDDCKDPDGIILRSFSMHDMELGSNLKGVARAGAGVNNIPIDACTERVLLCSTPRCKRKRSKRTGFVRTFDFFQKSSRRY